MWAARHLDCPVVGEVRRRLAQLILLVRSPQEAETDRDVRHGAAE